MESPQGLNGLLLKSRFSGILPDMVQKGALRCSEIFFRAQSPLPPSDNIYPHEFTVPFGSERFGQQLVNR